MLKTTINKLFWVTGYVLIAVVNMRAQQTILNYNTFIERVLHNNTLAEKAANTNAMGSNTLSAAKGLYDPFVQSGVENKYFSGKNYYTSSRTEIKQALYTNQYLKFGYEYGLGANIDPEKATSVYGLPYAGIEFSLLQGLTIDKRRAELIKARHYKNVYEAESKLILNELLLEGSQSYFDLLFFRKVTNICSYFRLLAGQRLKGIEELATLGERPAIDTVEASILFQSRELELQNAQLELLKRMQEMKIFLNSPPDQVIEFNDSLEHYYFRFKNSMPLIPETDQHPLMFQYAAKQKVLETESRFRKELIKPKLDLCYNFLSPYTNEQLNMFNTNNYKWSANISFPLFFRQPYHSYKIAVFEAKNNQLEMTNKFNQLYYKRQLVIRSLVLNENLISIAQQNVKLNKLLVEAEKLKFESGESSLFLLNSREQKWLETEIKLAEYYLKYLKLRLQLVYLNGGLEYKL